jgi:hypothetical protein
VGFCSIVVCSCQHQFKRAAFIWRIHTAAAALEGLSDTCTLSAGAVFALAASVAAGVDFEVAEAVVAGPEGVSPLTAGVLVVDAVSSMGAGRPTDCASFTTSLVTCSAITVSGTVVAKDSMSDSCSLLTETGVTGADSCVSGPLQRSWLMLMRAKQPRRAGGYLPSVKYYKSPRGSSGRFRRNVVCVGRGLTRRMRRCRLRCGRADV